MPYKKLLLPVLIGLASLSLTAMNQTPPVDILHVPFFARRNKPHRRDTYGLGAIFEFS